MFYWLNAVRLIRKFRMFIQADLFLERLTSLKVKIKYSLIRIWSYQQQNKIEADFCLNRLL